MSDTTDLIEAVKDLGNALDNDDAARLSRLARICQILLELPCPTRAAEQDRAEWAGPDALDGIAAVEETRLYKAEQRIKELETRLRAVIEAADRVMTDEATLLIKLNDAIANYRKVRDVQPPASPEPEASPRAHEFAGPDIHHDFQHNHSPTVSIREKCLVCGFTPQAHLCWSCGLPWSQHGGRR